MPATIIREQIGQKIWDKYFKFCVVRNPYEKLLSGFFYFTNDNDYESEKDLIDDFQIWIQKETALIDRDKYMIDGKTCMDFFIRYENLHEGLEHVCNILDIPFEPARLPVLKAGYRNNEISLKKLFNEEAIRFVESVYKFELEYFNYRLQE